MIDHADKQTVRQVCASLRALPEGVYNIARVCRDIGVSGEYWRQLKAQHDDRPRLRKPIEAVRDWLAENGRLREDGNSANERGTL